jgi:hypothetical protein
VSVPADRTRDARIGAEMARMPLVDLFGTLSEDGSTKSYLEALADHADALDIALRIASVRLNEPEEGIDGAQRTYDELLDLAAAKDAA